MPKIKKKPAAPSCGPPPGETALTDGQRLKSPYSPEQTAIFMRNLPDTLTEEEKLVTLCWQDRCFCCSSVLCLAQCMLSFLNAAGDKRQLDALAHWALNMIKLLDINPTVGVGFLMKLDIMRILVTQLDNVYDVSDSANGYQVNMHPVFAQQFNCAKTFAFRSTVQLVCLDLLSNIVETPMGARALVTDSTALTVLLLCMRTATDERFIQCGLQMLQEAYHAAEEGLLDSAVTPEHMEALTMTLLKGGIVPILTRSLSGSSNANVLKAAAGLACCLMVDKPWHAFGYLGPDRPQPELRCSGKGLVMMQDAGLEGLLIGVLARKPSQLVFWMNIDFRMSGTHLFELQAVVLGTLRALLESANSVGRPCGSALAASPVTAAWVAAQGPPGVYAASNSNGANNSSGGGNSAGSQERAGEGGASTDAATTAPEGASGQAAGSAGGAGSSSPGESSRPQPPPQPSEPIVLMPPATATDSSLPATDAAGGEGAALPIRADQAEALVVCMISAMQDGILANGIELQAMEPRERNLTPDYRLEQIQRIRKATEAARQESALATARPAIDKLTEAISKLGR